MRSYILSLLLMLFSGGLFPQQSFGGNSSFQSLTGYAGKTAALIPQRNQSIAYASFERPTSITEGDYAAAFTYNGADERVKMEQLGSITHIVNSGGGVVQELSYDAWGQLQNPTNQTVYTPGTEPELFLGRGYTGHEHLPAFGLVNMNTRLYDAALGRFLSPDPFIQNPFFSQNFNRYSYALNNPLCYIDRDGQFIWFIPIAAALIGAYIGGATANHSYNPLNWDWSSGKTWGYMGGGAVIGAASSVAVMFAAPVIGGALCGALGVGAGSVAGGAVIGSVGGTIAGFINGFGFSALDGGSFNDNLISGFKGAGWGAATGAVTGGIFNGVTNFFEGNNVWSGEAIAEGRNAFSFNNTPISTSQPPTLEPLPTIVPQVNVPQPSGGDIYPPNNGFESQPTSIELQPGQIIDRYGDETGRFFSPKGTSIENRSLPPTTNTNSYNSYKIIKPFPVQSGVTAPYYGQPGLLLTSVSRIVI